MCPGRNEDPLSPLRNAPANWLVARKGDGWCFVLWRDAAMAEPIGRQGGVIQHLLLPQPPHKQWGLAAHSELLTEGSVSPPFVQNESWNKTAHQNKSRISAAASNRGCKATKSITINTMQIRASPNTDLDHSEETRQSSRAIVWVGAETVSFIHSIFTNWQPFHNCAYSQRKHPYVWTRLHHAWPKWDARKAVYLTSGTLGGVL